MTETLPYHLAADEDLVLSLRFLNRSRSEAERVAGDIQDRSEDDVSVRVNISENFFDEYVYGVYAAESHTKRFPQNWEADLSEDDLILADTVIDAFRGVSEEWDSRGRSLNWYKKPQPAEICGALERVQWGQQTPAVAGEIMSELLCKHPLPNANHRTAVAFVRTYLQSLTDHQTAEFPPAGNYEGEWFSWAEDYIYESKRLLLLKRKPGLLQYAKQCGADCVQRKGGVEIDLHAHDFTSPHDLSQMAKTAHINRCTQLATELIERSDHSQLRDQMDDGKQVFVSRLRGPI